jgi:competence protein ComEA
VVCAAAAPFAVGLLAAWPRSAQLTTAFLLGVVVTLLSGHLLSMSRWSSRPAELDRPAGFAYRIDLNRATRAELLQVPGIGPALAERIETYRKEHGSFLDVNDLDRVPGIGPATLQRIAPWVCVRLDGTAPPTVNRSMDPSDLSAKKAESPPRKSSGKKEPPASPIDVNRASAEELQKLPGIGPVLSQRIIDERNKQPFRSPEDLIRVAGIGPKILEKVRAYVMVIPEPPRGVIAE